MIQRATLNGLPEELRARAQWCIAGPDKSPYVAGPTGLYRASPVQGPWHDFNTACALAEQYNARIGYIITSEDPFACIDLDVKDRTSVDKDNKHYPSDKWTTSLELERYVRIERAFDSYTELSTSGKGLHIWVKANIGAGARKDGVEVYSQERFIICTGMAVRSYNYELIDGVVTVHAPPADPTKESGVRDLVDRQELLETLVAEMRKGGDSKFELVELEEKYSDREIIDRASGASNYEKFNALCRGEWEQFGYPSQSEADMSLMSMFTFYSQSNEQCRRLFRMTALGKRDKAIRDDKYLNYTLEIIRGRQARETAVEIDRETLARQLVAEIQDNHIAEQQAHVQQQVQALPDVEGIPWPPGMAGALAGFIYNSAPRPVKEVAIVGAIGLLAGITGKVFVLPQSGLNIYMILIARSAIGKEAMHSGISIVLDKLRNSIPAAQQFVDFGDMASGPALTKACANNSSFVNVAGEWGRKLRRLSLEDGRDGPMQQLRTVMTNLYQKSGPTSVVGGINYSKKEENIGPVSGVAYSMIGETTPGTFYESLTESMMEDGFLSRFNIVEYNGKRPPANKNPITTMDPRLEEGLYGLVVQALTQISNFNHIHIMFDPKAKEMLDAFDAECDDEINKTDDESWRQMWNRAHLKTLRLAGILAAADNYIQPMIYPNHVEWALDLVRRDIRIMSRKIQEGDVGAGDGTRERKLLSVIKTYLQGNIAPGYKIPDDLVQAGIVPRKYLAIRTQQISSYTQHRSGATAALDITLRSLVDSGFISEINKDQVAEKYGFHGKCYRVLHLPDYKDL